MSEWPEIDAISDTKQTLQIFTFLKKRKLYTDIYEEDFVPHIKSRIGGITDITVRDIGLLAGTLALMIDSPPPSTIRRIFKNNY